MVCFYRISHERCRQALRQAGGILVEKFFLFSRAQIGEEDGAAAPAITQWA